MSHYDFKNDLATFRANSVRVAQELVGDIDIVDERTLGLHSLNPFVYANSSPRSYMMSSHLSQAVPLLFGDEKITLSGVESQLSENTFSVKAEADYRVIKVIPRYSVAGGLDVINSKTVIVQNINNNQVDFLEVPYNFQLHQTFGFKYKWSDLVNNLYPNDIIEKDTVLADSPNVRPNKGYAFGVNANLALMTIPEVSEDAVVISRSLAKKLAYTVYEKRVIEYDGNTKFPLNLYGDENNYKPFPDIGEYVNDDGVVMCLRKIDNLTSLSTLSVSDLREYDPQFDTPTYVRGPGEVRRDIIDGKEVILESGKVVDVKVYFNPKSKKETLNSVDEHTRKYILGLKKYYKDIIDTVEAIDVDYKHSYKSHVPISPRLKRLMMDAQAITNENNNKIKFNHRNVNCDTIRVEINIQFTVFNADISSKVSDLSGIRLLIRF